MRNSGIEECFEAYLLSFSIKIEDQLRLSIDAYSRADSGACPCHCCCLQHRYCIVCQDMLWVTVEGQSAEVDVDRRGDCAEDDFDVRGMPKAILIGEVIVLLGSRDASADRFGVASL